MGADRGNSCVSYDFVFDRCANGQKLKCLTVPDEWTKEGLAIEVDGCIRSSRVIEVLSRIACERGAPLYLRSDNGPEFVSRALLAWIVDQGIETALIDPGKPWQDGAGESFNGKFPDVPEPRMVPLAGGQGDDRSLAPALQRGAAPLEPRPSDAGGVRLEDRNRTPSGHDVADRCGMWCLRDPPRRSTASQGAV